MLTVVLPYMVKRLEIASQAEIHAIGENVQIRVLLHNQTHSSCRRDGGCVGILLVIIENANAAGDFISGCRSLRSFLQSELTWQ